MKIIIGLILIIGTIYGGNLKYLLDWSNVELIGFNLWTIFAMTIGSYLIYRGVKK